MNGNGPIGTTVKQYAIFIFIILLLAAAPGCLDDDDDDDAKVPASIPAPKWEVGMFWVYAFTTPDETDLVTRMVVAPDDGENHLVGTPSEEEARRHGVLNYNPLLGRVRLGSFSVYEAGVPQPLFLFPLTRDARWTFSFLGVSGWQARVESITRTVIPATGETVIVAIRAEGPGGEVMEYSFDTSAGWVHLMRARHADGTVMVNMTLVSHGSGFSGTAYFIRGYDLFDHEYASTPLNPVVSVYDSFLDAGHPRHGAFDRLIIFLNANVQSNSGGTLALRDHASTTAWLKTIGPNTRGTSLDDIPNVSGNWTLEVNLEGNTHVRLRVAGGIWYQWDV